MDFLNWDTFCFGYLNLQLPQKWFLKIIGTRISCSSCHYLSNNILHIPIKNHVTHVSWVLMVKSWLTCWFSPLLLAITYVSCLQMKILSPLAIFMFQDLFKGIKMPNLDKFWCLHFCFKYSKHSRISTFKAIPIQNCLEFTSFAPSHTHYCGNVCKL